MKENLSHKMHEGDLHYHVGIDLYVQDNAMSLVIID